jgi:hypothetical protein
MKMFATGDSAVVKIDSTNKDYNGIVKGVTSTGVWVLVKIDHEIRRLMFIPFRDIRHKDEWMNQ